MNKLSLALVSASSAVATVENGTIGRFNIGKKETTGTFARAIAFASKDDRAAMGHAMYARWLQNGMYRPLVTDILECGLIAKSAKPVVMEMAGLNDSGPVSKETLVRLCRAIQKSVDNALLDGKKAPAGQKGFVYGVVNAIASASHEGKETIDVQGTLVGDAE